MDREKNIKSLSAIITEKIAKSIETSIYNFAKEYSEVNETPFLIDSIYLDKFNEIYNLLINKKSIFLIEALKTNKIDPTKIALLKPDEYK